MSLCPICCSDQESRSYAGINRPVSPFVSSGIAKSGGGERVGFGEAES